MTAEIPEIGYKAHMNDISAAVGLSCISKAKMAVRRSVANAGYYQTALADVQGVRILEPPLTCEPSWWVYGFLSSDPEGLIRFLALKGVEATRLWRRNDTYACFTGTMGKAHSGMDVVAKHAVFVPNGWWVSDKERETIAQHIVDFHQRPREL